MINFTNITNANNTLDQLIALDRDLAGGWFAIFAILALFVIVLINMLYYNISGAFLFASFFASVAAGLLWIAGFLPFMPFIIATVLLLIFIIVAILWKG